MPRLAALALCAGLAAAGCAPTVTYHGFAPRLGELEAIEAGIDTRGTVLNRLGQPSATGSFDSRDWYYVASRMERRMFYAPEIVDRTVVAIRFDETGLVERVNRYGLEDGRVVDLVTETTPTFGRELTVLQQLFGNIGRANPAEALTQ